MAELKDEEWIVWRGVTSMAELLSLATRHAGYEPRMDYQIVDLAGLLRVTHGDRSSKDERRLSGCGARFQWRDNADSRIARRSTSVDLHGTQTSTRGLGRIHAFSCTFPMKYFSIFL